MKKILLFILLTLVLNQGLFSQGNFVDMKNNIGKVVTISMASGLKVLGTVSTVVNIANEATGAYQFAFDNKRVSMNDNDWADVRSINIGGYELLFEMIQDPKGGGIKLFKELFRLEAGAYDKIMMNTSIAAYCGDPKKTRKIIGKAQIKGIESEINMDLKLFYDGSVIYYLVLDNPKITCDKPQSDKIGGRIFVDLDLGFTNSGRFHYINDSWDNMFIKNYLNNKYAFEIPIGIRDYIVKNFNNLIVKAFLKDIGGWENPKEGKPFAISILGQPEERNQESSQTKMNQQNNKKEGKPTIAFIIDSSGSMKSSDPNDIRKSSVEQIVDLLSGNENIFLIDFDDKSKWLTSSNWNNWNRQDVKSAIKSIDSDGGTNIGLGLQTLRDALEQNITDYSRTAVVFLSDGKGTYKDEAQWFASKGIKIYTISYKNEADANLLNSIASSTGGIYIQANNESDVVAAFMQFNNDLQGLSKYVSYRGDFNGQSSLTVPSFNVDKDSKLLTVILNWSGVQKLIELISSSGKVYKKSSSISDNTVKLPDLNSYTASFQEFGLAEHGPVSSSYSETSIVTNDDVSDQEWIDGPGYTIVKIKNPEPGEWNATLNTEGSVVCNDAFLFEAMGDAGKEIKINESRSAGTYLYKLKESDPDLLWEKSKASIMLETPVGNKVDISANYKGGDFFFYPSNGIGSYQINATIWVTDAKNNTYQRQFSRSELVGELLPGYIAPVKETMGTYLITEQGKITGNRSGIKCFIYAPGGSSSAPKALGYVTFVNEKQCTIEISGVVKGRIEKGDFVELDVLQWKNDK